MHQSSLMFVNVSRRAVASAVVIGLFSVALGTSRVHADDNGIPHLWSAAVHVASSNDHWVPATVDVTERVYDHHDTVVETTRLIYALSESSADVVWELESAHVNGRDRTRAAKNGQEVGSFIENDAAPQERVFDPNLQHAVSGISLRGSRVVSGVPCSVLSFTMTLPDETWHGEAMIAEELAIPVEVRVVNSAGYREADGRVWDVEATIRYSADPSAWYAEEVTYALAFESRKFPFLSFRGRAEIAIQASGHISLEDYAL